jgi:hypothetical protein
LIYCIVSHVRILEILFASVRSKHSAFRIEKEGGEGAINTTSRVTTCFFSLATSELLPNYFLATSEQAPTNGTTLPLAARVAL